MTNIEELKHYLEQYKNTGRQINRQRAIEMFMHFYIEQLKDITDRQEKLEKTVSQLAEREK